MALGNSPDAVAAFALAAEGKSSAATAQPPVKSIAVQGEDYKVWQLSIDQQWWEEEGPITVTLTEPAVCWTPSSCQCGSNIAARGVWGCPVWLLGTARRSPASAVRSAPLRCPHS